MNYKCALVLLALLGAVSSMNLEHMQPAAIKKHNVLYFEANDKPSISTFANSTCPNPKFYCSENLTCCGSKNSSVFGCCPIPQGVCCDDGLHCCPPNSQCDMATGQCFMQNRQGYKLITRDWSVVAHHLKQEQLLKKVSAEIVCPGGKLSCPPSNTCCRSKTGDYQCCPYPQALCCSDQIHCCPKNYKCNISTGACIKTKDVVSWMTKYPAKPTLNGSENSVVCPGGKLQCPDGTTCCQMQSGQYGCCPYPKAVCCSDGIHCCPNGYKCDLSAGLCAQNGNALNALLQKPAVDTKDSVTCKDNSECPVGSTCCKLASDQYGCCPLEQAVCCSDNLHCCPDGYQCDVSAGTCKRGDDILAWLTKKPSKPAS